MRLFRICIGSTLRVLLSLLAMAAMTSCKKSAADLIVGNWKVIEKSSNSGSAIGDIWEFRSDGTLRMQRRGIVYGGNYRVEGSFLYTEGGWGSLAGTIADMDENFMKVDFSQYTLGFSRTTASITDHGGGNDDPVVEHPEPSIHIITGVDYITGTIDNPQVIDFEDPTMWKYGFHVESNPETHKELASLWVHYEFSFDEETGTYDTIIDLTGMTSYDFVESVYEDAKEIIFALKITATVTDVDGQTNTSNIAFKINWAGTLEPEEFLWNRHGAAEGTGLEMFGLKWTRNGAKVDYAIIEPMEGATLYTFQPEVWDETQTEFQKMDLFEEMPVAVASFKGVSAWASSDYDFVIGSTYEGENFLIHITRGEVSTFKGIDITITGEWK